MENRDRDKVSQSQSNREKHDSSVEFGQSIGRSEDRMNEPSRRSGSMEGSQKSTGWSGSSKSSDSSSLESNVSNKKGSDIESDLGRGSKGSSRQ